MVKINGEEKNEIVGMSITEMLNSMNLKKEHVAVGVNDVILSKDMFDGTIIKEGDTIEIVKFMGGGAF